MADSSRTESATPRKRQKVRREGRVARSRELPQAMVFLSVIVFLHFTGKSVLDRCMHVLAEFLQMPSRPHLDAATITTVFHLAADAAISIVGPILLVTITFSLAGSFGGGGLLLAPEALRLKLDRLSPAMGLQKLLPKSSVVELVKNLIYLSIVCYIAWKASVRFLPSLPGLALVSPYHAFNSLTDAIYTISIRVGILFGVIAIGDFLYQRYLFEESLKMTKQEVRDDYREIEGDPKIKGRIRRAQREMMRRRMMAEVPKADVVITNPTHFAVAVAYRPKSMAAPTVVAKGQDYMAARIREVATEHEVPIVENPPLAQALYKSTDVGKPIPAGLYKAIAELLAYLIKFRGLVLKEAREVMSHGY